MAAIEFPLNPLLGQEYPKPEDAQPGDVIWICENATGPIWARKVIEKLNTDGSNVMVGQLSLIDQNDITGLSLIHI